MTHTSEIKPFMTKFAVASSCIYFTAAMNHHFPNERILKVLFTINRLHW